MATIKHATMVH